MKTGFIDTAMNGFGSKYADKCYFFRNGHYIRFDWTLDRVTDGYPFYNAGWALPTPFNEKLDATLDGRAAFQGFTYFFKGDKYLKYNWTGEKMVSNTPSALSAWDLTGAFASSIDTAFNGVGENFKNYAYFFKDHQYVRYNWLTNKVEKDEFNNIFRPLSAWLLPPEFLNGIDAALNGVGKFAGSTYFFKGKQYCKYDWASKTCTPAKPILNNWNGLHEMMDACNAKTLALQWIDAAIAELPAFINNTPSPNKAVMEDGMKAHFHIDKTTPLDAKKGLLAILSSNFTQIRTIIANSQDFRWRNEAEKLTDWRGVVNEANGAVLYTFNKGTINFCKKFADFGPKCQTAMLVHEPIHKIDKEGTHIGEANFNQDYARLTADKAVHNPSSYAAFSQHIFFKKDERFGAGRPNE
jgi:hypothetical protein